VGSGVPVGGTKINKFVIHQGVKMKNYESLPPIIKDLIDALKKDDTPIHVRDNISARLENIITCCNDSVEQFRRKQTKHYTVKAKQKA
jgi:DNA-directed RNA polymerase subunit L